MATSDTMVLLVLNPLKTRIFVQQIFSYSSLHLISLYVLQSVPLMIFLKILVYQIKQYFQKLLKVDNKVKCTLWLLFLLFESCQCEILLKTPKSAAVNWFYSSSICVFDPQVLLLLQTPSFGQKWSAASDQIIQFRKREKSTIHPKN